MIDAKNLKKIISMIVVITFFLHFQSDILLPSPVKEATPEEKFIAAKKEYKNGKYNESKKKLEDIIAQSSTEMKYLVGKCHFLLGAVYEKLQCRQKAKDNYLKAKNKYKTAPIADIDLKNLEIYREIVKDKAPPPDESNTQPPESDELQNQFNKAKLAYTDGQYSEAIQRIERIIHYNPDRKGLLGKCHLLLGAVYEQLGEKQKAEENYKKAKDDYGIESIEGINLEKLEIYRKIIKGEKEQQDHVIPKEGPKKKKKKFPVLLVVGGIAVATAVILLLTKKKEEVKKEYTLTVNLGEGVEGTPQSGTNTYEEGTTKNYNYTLQPGYNNLAVQLDGTEVSASGTITMDRNHTLTASAGTNEVNFVTNQNEIQIPEGSTASFNVRLSAQPTADIDVTVARESGDTDISVISAGTLTFTTSNWNIDQSVTLQAAQDADTENGEATIAITAPGITQKNITVTEQDDDAVNDLTVKIVEPKDGTEVSRGITVEIEAEASSGSGIQKVEFYINNRLIKIDNNTPYRTSWDTTGELHGNYTIRAIAYDNNGNDKEDSITVSVLAI